MFDPDHTPSEALSAALTTLLSNPDTEDLADVVASIRCAQHGYMRDHDNLVRKQETTARLVAETARQLDDARTLAARMEGELDTTEKDLAEANRRLAMYHAPQPRYDEAQLMELIGDQRKEIDHKDRTIELLQRALDDTTKPRDPSGDVFEAVEVTTTSGEVWHGTLCETTRAHLKLSWDHPDGSGERLLRWDDVHRIVVRP
jgi:hypothetical protein